MSTNVSTCANDLREALLRDIADERVWWHGLLEEVGTERMEHPGAMGAWTFKDLIAHITAYRDRFVARLAAGPVGTPVAIWPPHLDDPATGGLDAVNAWIHTQHEHRPLAEVMADADASFDRLADAFRQISDEDLTIPGRFVWAPADRSLGDVIRGHLFDHVHVAHEPDVRAWMGLAANQRA